MRLLYVFALILAVKLASVFIAQTYFVPEEYWQRLEVAHKLTFGLVQTLRNKSNKSPVRKQLLITTAVYLVLMSLLEHKELSFVSSLLLLCSYVAAEMLSRWSQRATLTNVLIVAISILLLNVLPAWHQKEPTELMPKLHDIAQEYRDERDHRANILFLMPCHSTPYYSHIHENVTMCFLTCEPNLQQQENYKDEASEFLTNYNLLHQMQHIEVNRLSESQPLSEVWSTKLGTKSSDLSSLMKYLSSRSGSSILVYQRLKLGEENLTFNRAEFQEEEQEQEKLNEEPHESENMFN